jgi:hypothetical protein
VFPYYTLFHLSCTDRTETQTLYCFEGVFTAPLRSNGSYAIVDFVFVAVGMCLPSHCLAMGVYSDFSISAFGRHVTIYSTTSYGLGYHIDQEKNPTIEKLAGNVVCHADVMKLVGRIFVWLYCDAIVCTQESNNSNPRFIGSSNSVRASHACCTLYDLIWALLPIAVCEVLIPVPYERSRVS